MQIYYEVNMNTIRVLMINVNHIIERYLPVIYSTCIIARRTGQARGGGFQRKHRENFVIKNRSFYRLTWQTIKIPQNEYSAKVYLYIF